MRNPAILALCAFCILGGSAAFASGTSLVHDRGEFDARNLLSPGAGLSGEGASGASLSLAHPSRFTMRQSYSLSAMAGREGSVSSGVYLNTVTYQLADPLSFSVDFGIHTPIHSTVPGLYSRSGAAGSSLILPRMGLEYRPSDRMSVHVELFNGPDAWKAYGAGMTRYPRTFPGARFAH